MSMTSTEIGAYMLLIMAHYKNGVKGIPSDDKTIRRITRTDRKQWSRIKDTILEKFETKGEWLIHDRIVKEIQKMVPKRDTTGDALESKSGTSSKSKPLKNKQTDTDITTNHKPLTNKEEKNTKKELVIPEFIDGEVWQDFVKHRGGSKFTRLMATRIINRLTEWQADGYNPNEILNNSIMNGYKGIFLPRGQTNGNNRPTNAERLKTAGDEAVAEILAEKRGRRGTENLAIEGHAHTIVRNI